MLPKGFVAMRNAMRPMKPMKSMGRAWQAFRLRVARWRAKQLIAKGRFSAASRILRLEYSRRNPVTGELVGLFDAMGLWFRQQLEMVDQQGGESVADEHAKGCKVDNGIIDLCKGLDKVLHPEANRKGRGAYLLALMNLKTGETTKTGDIIQSGEYGKHGDLMNFCPF